MVWNPNFPTQATLISQSTAQIQTNWNFIATTVGTDHFYNTVDPNENGHHKWVQMLDGGNIPVAAGMDGVVYLKTSGSVIQPFFRNISTILQIAKTYNFTGTLLANTPPLTDNLVFNVAAPPAGLGSLGAFVGLFMIYTQGATGANGAALIYYDTVTDLTVTSLSDQGGIDDITALIAGPNAYINVISGGASGPFNAALLIMEF